jgi:hypothetical protein
VRDAFDVNIGAPELDSTADDDEFVLVARELAEQAALTVENAKGSGFDLVVVLSGRDAHRFSAELDDARVAFACAAEHDHDSSCKEILAVLNEPGWTAVRYASGHTVSDSRIYEMRQLPVSFEPNFSVLPSDVDAHEEKPRNAKQPKSDGTRERDSLEPVALANTLATDRLLTNQCSEGREKRSLFNWIVFDRPEDVLPAGGWLLCDDGAGEHADFVHLDSQNCVVRLIHVKAAHSKAASISLGDFEEVVSQAIKNARWLAFDDMSKRLATQPAKHLKDLVWPPPDISFAPGENKRARFADELENLGEDVTRHVVVVQPGLTQSAWDNAVTAKQKIARELLSTLLFSARATCFGLAADFTVVGHADN